MNKKTIYSALSLVCVVALAAVILIFNGGKKNSSTAPEVVVSAVMPYVAQENVQQADAQMIKRLYGIQPSDYASVTLYYPKTNMGADEFLLVKLADGGNASAVLAGIDRRLSAQKTTFDGYGPEQYALLTEHAVIEDRGNYVMFFVGAADAQARQALIAAL